MLSGAILIIGSSIAFAIFVSREDFVSLMAAVSAAFLGLVLLSSVSVRKKWLWITGLMLAMRIPLFFSSPVLSDDFYRFLWDGRLFAQGEDPYSALPELLPQVLKNRIDGNGELLQNMNSPRYFSVYPPFQQAIFAGISALGNGNTSNEILVTRLLFVLADLLSLWLLIRLIALRGGNSWRALWFSLNPLIAWEGVGNLHFEVFSVPFILGAVFLYFRYNKPWTSIFLFALGASLKLRPLMLNLLALRHHKAWLFAAVGVLLVLAPFAFFPFSSLENYRASLRLYSESFEFNASMYYLLREAGELLIGYNPIAILGPALQLLALVAMFYVSWNFRKVGLSEVLGRSVAVYGLYLLCATTVHPWYLVVPLALSLAAGKRWVAVWSFSVFLSYSHYTGGEFKERYAWIALEYFLVAAAFWLEITGVKRRASVPGTT